MSAGGFSLLMTVAACAMSVAAAITDRTSLAGVAITYSTLAVVAEHRRRP